MPTDQNPADPIPAPARRKSEAVALPKIRLSWMANPLFTACVAALYVFLLMPLLIVIFASFSPTRSNTYAISHASLRWYRAFLNDDGFVDAFKFSFLLALIASAISTAIGFVTSYGIVRFMQARRELAQSMAMLPMMVPNILISLSLLLLLTVLHIPAMLALVIGHVLICLPFTIAGITASLEGVDADAEAAAHTLGAPRWRVLLEITIPLSASGILSAAIFAFVISFGDVYIALFLSGPGTTTLPIQIYSYIQWQSSPVIAAITTVQIVMIVLFGLLIERLAGLRAAMRI